MEPVKLNFGGLQEKVLEQIRQTRNKLDIVHTTNRHYCCVIATLLLSRASWTLLGLQVRLLVHLKNLLHLDRINYGKFITQ